MSSDVVTLYVVDISPWKDKGGDTVRVRTFKYTRTKTTLTSIPENDAPEPPHGLRRIPVKKLPAVGGLFGLCVAAETREEAVEALLKVAEKERTTATERVHVLSVGIEALKNLK